MLFLSFLTKGACHIVRTELDSYCFWPASFLMEDPALGHKGPGLAHTVSHVSNNSETVKKWDCNSSEANQSSSLALLTLTLEKDSWLFLFLFFIEIFNWCFRSRIQTLGGNCFLEEGNIWTDKDRPRFKRQRERRAGTLERQAARRSEKALAEKPHISLPETGSWSQSANSVSCLSDFSLVELINAPSSLKT